MNRRSFPHTNRSTASINATVVKAAAAELVAVSVINTSASIRYLRFYDQITAPNPAADSANHVFTLPVPASTNGAGQVISFSLPMAFMRGLSYTVTAGVGANDATAVGANEVFVNLAWT